MRRVDLHAIKSGRTGYELTKREGVLLVVTFVGLATTLVVLTQRLGG